MARGLSPGINQLIAEARMNPDGTFQTGFGFQAPATVVTPLQVYDLAYDPDMVGTVTDALDGCTADVLVESEVGANWRVAILANNAGLLRVSIVDGATGLAANLLTTVRIRVFRMITT